MQKSTPLLWAVCLMLLGTMAQHGYAQPCDPAITPGALNSLVLPGTGVRLEWDAVPESQGIFLSGTAPSGLTVSRRLLGSELGLYLIPENRLEPGTYTWRVQAACSVVFPFVLTPVSASTSFVIAGSTSCPSSVLDTDGNSYSTVLIGSQCWMQSNLAATHYRNGDSIPVGLSDIFWAGTPDGAAAPYDGDPVNVATYGLLYNGHAVMDSRGICPSGWHVPTDAEWNALVIHLDPLACTTCLGSQSSVVGGAMKTTGTLDTGTGLWRAPNAGANNSSGFNGLPAGYRNQDGDYFTRGYNADWWSRTPGFGSTVWLRELAHANSTIARGSDSRQDGFSVRCLKD